MPNKGLSEAFLDPKKPKNRSEFGAQEVWSPRFFRKFIATLNREASERRRRLLFEVYGISWGSKNSDFPKENQWFLRFRRFRCRIVFLPYFPRLGPPRKPQKPWILIKKNYFFGSERRFFLKGLVRSHPRSIFGPKWAPRPPPNRFQNRFKSGVPLLIASWVNFFRLQKALSSTLDHFGSDFGPYWDRFWIHNWFQKHEKVKKLKVSLGHVQPKFRPRWDQVWHQI